MINYKLAKELKDVGFFQGQDINGNRGQGRWTIDGIIFYPFPLQENCFYIPTLSELIEACGKSHLPSDGELYGEFFFKLESASNGWGAHYEDNEGEVMGHGDLSAIGSTPEEAVARLWLVLNKK